MVALAASAHAQQWQIVFDSQVGGVTAHCISVGSVWRWAEPLGVVLAAGSRLCNRIVGRELPRAFESRRAGVLLRAAAQARQHGCSCSFSVSGSGWIAGIALRMALAWLLSGLGTQL